MTIGELAKQTNTRTQTIRYYERISLLPTPERGESNYRLYTTDAADRLAFITRAKNLGFTLNDIKTLFGLADGRISRCSEVSGFINEKLTSVQKQIVDLRIIEQTLSALSKECDLSDRIDDCPVLDTLTSSLGAEDLENSNAN